MLSGKIKQGDGTVTDYINRLNRACLKIANVTDMDRIVWFMNGLCEQLTHVCVCDAMGKTWTNFTTLKHHALAKEMERNSRLKFAKLARPQVPFAVKKARYTQERSNRSDHFIPTTPRHSLAYTKVQEGGQGSQGGQGFRTVGPRGQAQRPREAAVAPERTAAKEPYFKGPPGAPNTMNNFISNAQANWLKEKKLCIYCSKNFHGTGQDKKAIVCKQKGQDINMDYLAERGMPKNNFN
jgi:hypothetical protein